VEVIYHVLSEPAHKDGPRAQPLRTKDAADE